MYHWAKKVGSVEDTQTQLYSSRLLNKLLPRSQIKLDPHKLCVALNLPIGL